jgi:myo-inositol-1(or 4)-monophosphatase
MWENEKQVAREAANEAGAILKRLFGRTHRIVKKGDIDLVTEADLLAEEKILEILRGSFPEDTILSEEKGIQRSQSERTWLVDPLDGTTNFAHGFPFFAVSIALEVAGEGVLGVVFNPYTKEHFHATVGEGAFLNGRPLQVSKIHNMGDALLATGFPYTIHQDPNPIVEDLKKMVVIAQGVRRPGSAAIDLCYLAAGMVDGFWEKGLKPWDTAAGTVIVREAGGIITDYEGKPYSPYADSIIAANPFIHPSMLAVLRPG